MRKTPPAADPEAYVAALGGWRRACVEALRDAVRAAGAALDERVKWGHLVYLSEGPVLLIRAEEERVLLGFWRGQRLRDVEPRLKPGGHYEMATLELRQGMVVEPATTRRLTREAVALNRSLGDPTLAARPSRERKAPPVRGRSRAQERAAVGRRRRGGAGRPVEPLGAPSRRGRIGG